MSCERENFILLIYNFSAVLALAPFGFGVVSHVGRLSTKVQAAHMSDPYVYIIEDTR